MTGVQTCALPILRNVLAHLIQALRQHVPHARFTGIGGPRMAAAGFQTMFPMEKLAVMGIVEVLRHVPSHWRLLRRLTARMEAGQVGLAILIDYGGFNLRVAAAARRAGVPVLYYVTPQVWASRPGRMKVMARVITKAAVILPFEEALLRQHGVNARFVGHPLLDRAAALPSREEARARLGLPATGEVLALFPGSRPQEIARHTRDFAEVARELVRRRPGLTVVIGLAPGVTLDPAALPFRTVSSASFDVLRAADEIGRAHV